MKRHKVVMALDSGHDFAHTVWLMSWSPPTTTARISISRPSSGTIAKAEAGRELTPQELAAALDEALGDTAVQDIDINIELTAP